MKNPPGLVGRMGLCDYGGKLHIPDPEHLDWHHGRITTYCGREWPLPKRMRTWADVDEDQVCKPCLRSSQVTDVAVHEKHKRLWSRFWRRFSESSS